MPVEEPDYYDLLGLGADPSDEDIDAGFRRAANLYHPDHNKSPGAAQNFIWASKARETLKDPAKRAAYDEARATRKRHYGGGGFPPSPPPPPREKLVIKVSRTRIAVEAVQGQPIRASFRVSLKSGELPPKWRIAWKGDGKLIDDAAVFTMDGVDKLPTTITVELPPQPKKGVFEGSFEVYIEEET